MLGDARHDTTQLTPDRPAALAGSIEHSALPYSDPGGLATVLTLTRRSGAAEGGPYLTLSNPSHAYSSSHAGFMRRLSRTRALKVPVQEAICHTARCWSKVGAEWP